MRSFNAWILVFIVFTFVALSGCMVHRDEAFEVCDLSSTLETTCSEEAIKIDLDTFKKYTTDIEMLVNLGRALPHSGPDGETDGYRITGITEGSLLDDLGFKNGDVIHAANGKPVRSMQEGMIAFEDFKKSSRVVIDITRRGELETFEYVIQ